jgi:O-antigen ligase
MRDRTAALWRALWLILALASISASFLLPPLWAAIGVCGLAAVLVTLRWPVAGLVLFVFSVPWGGGFPVPLAGAPVTSTELIVAALTAAWLVSGVVERRLPLGTRLWTPYLILFLAVIGASMTQAVDLHASMREVLKWLEMTLVYLAACWFLRSRRDLHIVIAALALAGVSQAMLGYIQFGFHLGPQAFAVRGNFIRAFGTFDQPNPYAGYLNMVFPLALTMALGGGTRAGQPLYGVAALLMAGAVLVSESRGALLAALVANSIVLAILYWRYRLLASVAVVIGAIGGLLSTFSLVPTGPFERLLDAAGLGNVSFGNVTNANFSAVERAAHWLAGVRMFATHPLLGVGIGNYADAYPAYHPRGWYDPLEHAHNYYINIAAEAGVAGLLAYLLLIGSAVWYCCALLWRLRDRRLLAVVLGVLGALVATSFHNLFDVLYVHGMAALLGLLVALAAVSARLDDAPAPANR